MLLAKCPWLKCATLLSVLTLVTHHAAAEEARRESGAVRVIGGDKILFVDHEFIEKVENAELNLHPPRKTGERLVESEYPWESATLNWFSVLKDGAKYRMWYECYDVDGWPTADDTSFCYAESTDGVHWVKPKLGLFSYRGSKDNNVLFRTIGADQNKSRVHGSCVFLDPSAPPDARYKCVSQGMFQGIGDRPYYVAGMTSPDGLTWTRYPRPICPVFADSQYSGFWDEPRRHYAIFGRAAGYGGRAIGRSVSDVFDSFSPLTESCVLQVNETDPAESDLYNPACQQYPGTPSLYVMFPSLFRHREDTLDIRLAVSRDGARWTWPERKASFIPLGKAGDFDAGSLYMANGACQLVGDEFFFYFSGSPLKHGEVELPQLNDPRNRRVITRAVAPRDRLVSITSTKEGRVATRAVRFAGQRLVVNAAARPGGLVRVGLLDDQGLPIPGRDVADCQGLMNDQIAWTVSWSGGSDVSRWSGEPVRLRFELRDADVFGFQFSGESP